MEIEQEVTEEQQVNFETSEVGTMENEQEITEEQQVNFETSEVGTMENEQEVTEEQGPPTEKSKTISTKAPSKKEQLPRLLIDIPEYNKSYCRTHHHTSNTIECNWEIVDFPKLYKLIKTFVTEPFPGKEESQIEIQINIVPTFEDPSDDIIEFYILTNTEFTGFYNIYQVGPMGKQLLISERALLKNMMLLYKTKISTFMKNTYADLLIMNFKFDIIYKHSNISVVYINSLPITKYLESQISIFDNDSKFDNKESITFIIDGEHYSISKNLLCATNSSYFKLLCNAEEDITDKLIITDKSDVFKEMLSFIMINDSSSKINLDVWERRLYKNDIIIKDLLIMANKYDVKNLKYLCEQSLLRDITTENALELMQIAIQSDAKCLEKFVRGFLLFHIEIVKNKQLLSLPQEQMNKIIELINKTEVSDEYSATV